MEKNGRPPKYFTWSSNWEPLTPVKEYRGQGLVVSLRLITFGGLLLSELIEITVKKEGNRRIELRARVDSRSEPENIKIPIYHSGYWEKKISKGMRA